MCIRDRGIISALCSVVGTNFCFTYPYFAIDFSVSGYPFKFFIMGAVALGSCALTVNMRKQRDQAHQREKMTQVINEVDQRLLQVECKKDIVALLLECLYTQLECPILYMELQGDKDVYKRQVIVYLKMRSHGRRSIKLEMPIPYGSFLHWKNNKAMAAGRP